MLARPQKFLINSDISETIEARKLGLSMWNTNTVALPFSKTKYENEFYLDLY